MAHNKMQSYLRKLNKWVTELTFAKAKVLTPKSYNRAGGMQELKTHRHLQSALQGQKFTRARRGSKEHRGEQQWHHNIRKKSVKGLILLVCLTQLPYLPRIWGKIQRSCVAQASRLIQFKKKLSQAHVNIDLLSHPQLSAFKHLQENLWACKAFIACQWQESW